MNKVDFRKWLTNNMGKDTHQATDIVSRVSRVEKVLCDLDGKETDICDQISKDGGIAVLTMLNVNERKNYPNSINLPHNTVGLSQLKTSVKYYIKFMESKFDGTE